MTIIAFADHVHVNAEGMHMGLFRSGQGQPPVRAVRRIVYTLFTSQPENPWG
jgi:hypothetical protein